MPDATERFRIDRRRARAAFERAAGDYDRHARVQRAVAEGLLDRLAPVRIEPTLVVDAGAGTGAGARALARRYRKARVVALDLAHGMLVQARRGTSRWAPRRRAREHFVCADAARLPLADASVDLVYSSLMLQWCDDPEPVFREFRRVLAPGGLLQFATLGPDTLRELRASWAAADGGIHVHAFLDMHDVGDALVRAGLSDVVMDVERLTFHYSDAVHLMRDLKSLGARNAARGRAAGLTGRRRLERVRAAYEALRQPEGLPASYEAVYGHAWAPRASVHEVPVEALAARGRRGAGTGGAGGIDPQRR